MRGFKHLVLDMFFNFLAVENIHPEFQGFFDVVFKMLAGDNIHSVEV